MSQTVTMATSGSGVRLRFSNLYGPLPVNLGAVTVSLADGAPVPVTFDGQRAVRIPAGAPRLSDPIDLPVDRLATLTISVFYPEPTFLPLHRLRQVTRDGDVTGQPVPSGLEPTRLGVLLSGVEVRTERPAPVIVAFGDSITEGVSASPAGPGGWPERLLRRLVDVSSPWSVVNAGIGGNRLLYRGSGPSGLERLDADALAVPGAQCLIVLEGINDIGRPMRSAYAHEAITADDLVAGYRQIIARAHAAGIKVVVGTILPFEGSPYFSDAGETVRQQVNTWVRTAGEADGMIDFDRAVRDPASPSRLLPRYDSGDRLHPSDAGYETMAGSIPLDLCD
jgi:lysophospholipase L1-like esterase